MELDPSWKLTEEQYERSVDNREHIAALCRQLKCQPEEIEDRIAAVQADLEKERELLQFYETHHPLILGSHDVIDGVHVIVGKVAFVANDPQ